jgi:hypothetical protein
VSDRRVTVTIMINTDGFYASLTRAQQLFDRISGRLRRPAQERRRRELRAKRERRRRRQQAGQRR